MASASRFSCCLDWSALGQTVPLDGGMARDREQESDRRVCQAPPTPLANSLDALSDSAPAASVRKKGEVAKLPWSREHAPSTRKSRRHVLRTGASKRSTGRPLRNASHPAILKVFLPPAEACLSALSASQERRCRGA